MMATRIILILVLIGVYAISGLYFFTDFFLSPYKKFLNKLEYSKNMRFDAIECNILDYDKWQYGAVL